MLQARHRQSAAVPFQLQLQLAVLQRRCCRGLVGDALDGDGRQQLSFGLVLYLPPQDSLRLQLSLPQLGYYQLRVRPTASVVLVFYCNDGVRIGLHLIAQ